MQSNPRFPGELKNKVVLTFELHGAQHPVKKIDGEDVPVRIDVQETLSMHENANFRRLFEGMKAGRDNIRHMAQMLGEAFSVEVFHHHGKDGKVYAYLREQNGPYRISPPLLKNPMTGETVPLDVPAAVSTTRCFLFKVADKEMWDSIYIPGTYPDGNSKDKYRDAIRRASNWKDCPASRLIESANPYEASVSQDTVKLEAEVYEGDPFGDDNFFSSQSVAPAPQAQTATEAATVYANRFRRR